MKSCGNPSGALLAQELVHECDGDASLTDAGGYALDGSGSYVSHGENAGSRRLHQIRISVDVPMASLHDVVARAQKTAFVSRNLLRQPCCVRVGADECEKRRSFPT